MHVRFRKLQKENIQSIQNQKHFISATSLKKSINWQQTSGSIDNLSASFRSYIFVVQLYWHCGQSLADASPVQGFIIQPAHYK